MAEPHPSWGGFRLLRGFLALAMLGLAGGMLLPPDWWGMGEIAPHQLKVQLAGDRAPLVVDVRTAPEFSGGHIAGAVSIPLHRLPFTLAQLTPHHGQEMVLICLSGHRSRLAGALLRLNGYAPVTNLTGGMAAWRQGGFPVVTNR